MTLKWLALLFFVLFAVLPTFPQQPVATTPVTRDPQAVALAGASLATLSGKLAISDVTLTGTATVTVGPDIESGNFTLKGLGTTESRLDLNLTKGLTSEIRNTDPTGAPQGFLIKSSASAVPYAQHNCMTSAVWFFPALSVLAQINDPTVSVSFVGQETRDGEAVNHIQFNTQSTSLGPSSSLQLGQTDLYLDSTSNLPVVMIFMTHPDSNALTNIPVEIDFGDYQVVNGVTVPLRIQKFFNGTLLLDLTVQNVSVNTGLTDSAFASN
jgi:hypothetical protein